MTDTKTQPQAEPTMEEILASIRRIISENDEEQEAKKRSEEEAAAASMAASDAKRAAVGLGVLELTEMVAEDGSVVSLSADGQEPAADDQTVVTVEEVSVVEEPGNKPHEEVEQIVEIAEAEMTMENPKDDSVEFAPGGSSPSNAGSAGTAPSPRDDGLVSAATAAAATATFSQLARTLAQEPSNMSGGMPLGSGRTLEDLVKEMIRPMLKDWLDKNLQPIVEHAVRRELDRMTRRAEDI